MNREPAQPATARVRQGGCSWKRHEELSDDLKAYPDDVVLDAAWLSQLKQLLRRAAQGTVRTEDWEYPCATARGLIGELKMTHTHEREVDGEWEDLRVWHRVYYHEPDKCPTELWAMSAGCKVDGDAAAGAKQQAAINRACSRIMVTDSLGRSLLDWPAT